MGLFSEIHRVWLTIDNRLYLWDYTSAQDKAINTFDDQEQIIVSVGLVKPLPGVFLDQIEYILVVATPLEIILLGIAFTHGREEMTIYRTEMSIPSDNVNMTYIVGTDSGRIFMRGNNGQLYEIEYQANEGWLTRKMRKINHSSSGLDLFVPSFLNWGASENIKFISLDSERHLLYTISKDSHVELISLGSDGRGFARIAKLTDVLSQALRYGENQPQSSLDERNFQIIGLSPVPILESNSVCAVAVTSTGHRLYFANTDSWTLNSSRSVTGLRLAYVLGPPLLPGSSANYPAMAGIKIHQSFYSQGFFLAAQSVSDEVDRLIGSGIDAGMVSRSTEKFLAESTGFVDIEGKTWAIVPAPTSHKNGKLTTGYFLNELSTQFEFPAKKFLLLTNTGITTLVKLRPVDLLLQLINSSPNRDLRSFQDFFNGFGRDQTCAMSLAIACGHSSIKSGSDSISPQTIMMATKLFFELGGRPTIGTGPVAAPSGGLLGVPLSTSEIKTSAKHNGLALYLGRILRPIWKYHLIKQIPGKAVYESTFKVEDLVAVQQELQSLHLFLSQYKRFTAPPTPDSRPSGIEPEAWRYEQESLCNMNELLGHAIEAISFLSLLMDYRLSTIIVNLTDTEKAEMNTMTFEGFVSTPKGRDMGRVLMTALVNKQIYKDVGVDVVTGVLQQRCPSICQANDVILYKGMEILQGARVTANPEQQQESLRESLRLFVSVVQTIPFDKLKDIIENFKVLRFYMGVVDLTLKYASFQELIEDSPTSVEVQTNNQAYFKRLDCYQLIFNTLEAIEVLPSQQIPGKTRVTSEEALSMKKSLLDKCVASTDLFFHSCLYEWFIKSGRFEELLELPSPYLEEFLIREQGDLEKTELLWRLYVRSGRFIEAANVLSQMAQFPNLNLTKRLEYLTKAVANARSSSGIDVGNAKELMTELNDSLDVARIQMEIYQTLSNKMGVDEYLAELDAGLFDINELFHHFAKPFRMHEITLLILYTSDHGPQARSIIESSWTEVIRNSLDEAQVTGRLPFDALSDKVKDLGRRFYPNESVFNIRWLVDKLEQESLQRFDQVADFDRDWVIKTFLDIPVPFTKLFSTYHELFEAKIPPWSTNKSLAFLIGDISLLLKHWLEHIRSPSVSNFERLEFPARVVDDAISKYYVTLSTDSRALTAQLHQQQARVRSIF